MAIIKCPECGGNVSDKAQTCIHCGFPLIVDKKVKILFPIIPTLLGVRSRISATVNGKVVYSGGLSEETAAFEIEEPTVVDIRIQRWPDKIFRYKIEPGKRYQLVLKLARAGMGFDLAFNEVDVIDTDVAR